MSAIRNLTLGTLVLALAACAPGTYGAPQDGEADAGSSSACPDTIVIRDFDFHPASCTVEAGTTLTFVNEDDVAHTATADANAASSFDTGTLAAGASATVTFDAPGANPYFCELHPSMQATIEVTGDAAADGAGGDAGDDGNGGARY